MAREPRAARRRAAGAAGVLLAVLAAAVTLAAPARATGYRYWAFWQRTGAGWTFAETGPAGTTPGDGAVEGWRFGVSADSAAALRPRGPVSFTAVCGHVPAERGRKRVALVIDYGTAAGAPRERTGCASLPADGSAADALAAVAAPLRYAASGLVCAVSGYPATGCGERVSGPSGAAANPPARHGSSPAVGPFAGIGVVVLLGAGAVWQARRRRER